MSDQPRVAKVLVVLLFSMTACAVVLMVMNGKPPAAGPFSLSTYYRLDPIDDAIASDATQSMNRWNCIEIYYSQTKAGNIDQLSSLAGLSSPDQLNCHFVICNGLGETDGTIQTTRRWKRQWSPVPNQTWYGTPQTIRVCIVSDGNEVPATSSQYRRTEALVEKLARKFDISPALSYYPDTWR